MEKLLYEELMYKEWKTNVLDNYARLSSLPLFDKLYDFRNHLYDFFYPLGISTNRIHDVCLVTSALHHAFVDDGELSIVAAYVQEKEHYIPNLFLSRIPEQVVFFVCHGWYSDLTPERVYKFATTHHVSHDVNRIVAANFSEDVFDSLHSMIPDFAKEQEAGEISDESYFDIRKSNKQKIENLILSALS